MERDRVIVGLRSPAASHTGLRIETIDGQEKLILSLWPGYKTGQAKTLFAQPSLVDDVFRLLESDGAGSATWAAGPIFGIGHIRNRRDLRPRVGLTEFLAAWGRHPERIGAIGETEFWGACGPLVP